jgi:hypothetical protein
MKRLENQRTRLRINVNRLHAHRTEQLHQDHLLLTVGIGNQIDRVWSTGRRRRELLKAKQPIIALPTEPVEHQTLAVATPALAVALLNEAQRLNKAKAEAATISVALCLVLPPAAVLNAITVATWLMSRQSFGLPYI